MRFAGELEALHPEAGVGRGVADAVQLRRGSGHGVGDMIQLGPVHRTVVQGVAQGVQPAPAFADQAGGIVVARLIDLEEALGATFLGALAWRRARAHGGSPLAVRQLFLAELAIALGAISSVAVLAQWSTRLALSPCLA